jgi:hypothetical protein
LKAETLAVVCGMRRPAQSFSPSVMLGFFSNSPFFSNNEDFAKKVFHPAVPELEYMLKTSADPAAELRLILAPYEQRMTYINAGFLLVEAIVYVADGLAGEKTFKVTTDEWTELAPLAAAALDFALESPESFVETHYAKDSMIRNRLVKLRQLLPQTVPTS